MATRHETELAFARALLGLAFQRNDELDAELRALRAESRLERLVQAAVAFRNWVESDRARHDLEADLRTAVDAYLAERAQP
jgi:hypothetical protein